MKALIVGCGWVGTFLAERLINTGYVVWATCTSHEKAQRLAKKDNLLTHVVDFDRSTASVRISENAFDVVVVSVPVRRKDTKETIQVRFRELSHFLRQFSFAQSFFFSSVGIYPKISATIAEDTLADADLDDRLLLGESLLRADFPAINILRLGGLFGYDRIMAKYFVNKICSIGFQTANAVHVDDIVGIIETMVKQVVHGKTYNTTCPEHPIKKDVIEVSAAKYGYDLPLAFSDDDRTAKIVSSSRLQADLGYQFIYPSPLQF